MHYYFVWVRSERYRGNEPLTYKSLTPLKPGTVVHAPLKSETVLGFVSGPAPEPSFAAKTIEPLSSGMCLPPTTLQLAQWLRTYYPSPLGVLAAQFLPREMPQAFPTPTIKITTGSALPPLTKLQQAVIGEMDTPDTYVLHGKTGSGKTRIYLELAKRQLDAGRSCLMLTPEIGLTSSLADQVRNAFGKCIILHSQLTARERQHAWTNILSATEPIIVVGPRSALFSPLRNIGLIVLDEAHDNAYKQEQPPYYLSSRVAAALRTIHNAHLVLGSATPAITDYYLAVEKKKKILRLDTLAIEKHFSSEITIIDYKDRTQFVQSTHLSEPLMHAIGESLAKHEQILLYLNRRGTARITICQHCGWQALCPHCDLPMVYHGDQHALLCHTCGIQQPPRSSCPVCANASLTLRGFGTKAIAEEVAKLFPGARVQRFDADNRKHERLEAHYDQLRQGSVDVLIGTQLIAKGLDLPRLSTVGVILADTSLYLPDYTARERTYQLLNQVVGRVGRGHLAGKAIIQTCYPTSSTLAAAMSDDWSTFYAGELAERKQFYFPPYCSLLKISCRRASAASAERALRSFAQALLSQDLDITIEGPAPSFHEKISGKYQWQLVCKAKRRSVLTQVTKAVPSGWTYDLDPVDLL